MYQPYADVKYYFDTYEGSILDENTANKYLLEASRAIDILTYNRIIGIGFDKLTGYQQRIIKEVCCEYASFLYENEDILKTYLQSYSINGVNMSFGVSWNIFAERGVAIPKQLYESLNSTGLTCRSFFYEQVA